MIGMVQSLNVSVASALILYEAQRQRQNAGMYQRATACCRKKNSSACCLKAVIRCWLASPDKRLPYPHVNEQGEVEADAEWWATMQAPR
jgi:tRNA (guanosine-2'-O-)-methyltransferase